MADNEHAPVDADFSGANWVDGFLSALLGACLCGTEGILRFNAQPALAAFAQNPLYRKNLPMPFSCTRGRRCLWDDATTFPDLVH